MKNTKMKRTVMLMLGVIIGISVLTAQDNNTNSLLWKVEGNGLEAPSYLFGTIHMLCEGDFEMKGKVVKALKDADGLVMELDYSNAEEMAIMQQSAIGKQKISEQLNEEQLKQLDALLLAKVGMSATALDQYSLMTVNAILLVNGLGCQNMKMFESELAAIAMEESKNIGGLEKVSDQMEKFDKAYPTDFMFSQLMLIDDYMESFDQMVIAYKEENISELLAGLTAEKFMDENAIKYILNDRNNDWAEKIPSLIETESKFIAVGAAHLAGEQGLIQLLKKKGYTVSPVL